MNHVLHTAARQLARPRRRLKRYLDRQDSVDRALSGSRMPAVDPTYVLC